MPTAPVSGAVAQLGVLTSSYLNSSQESGPERYLAQVHIAYPHQPPSHRGGKITLDLGDDRV